MTVARSDVDTIMEQASLALKRMDYLGCEAHCLKALALTRENQDWPNYARVLLPLQEARRQRRMIAADGVVRLGSNDLGQPSEWIEKLSNGGCILLTHPHTIDQARELCQTTRSRDLYVEVLYADNTADASPWRLRSFQGPAVECDVEAPPENWLDCWINGGSISADTNSPQDKPEGFPGRAADWFLDCCEALGDAAMSQVSDTLAPQQYIEALESCLLVVTDHELLHQHLWDAAGKATLTGTSAS